MLITKLKKVYPLIAGKTSGKLTKFELLMRLNGLGEICLGIISKQERQSTCHYLFVCFSPTFLLVCV